MDKRHDELLLEAKTYSEKTEYPLPLDKIQEFEQLYQKIIEEGYLANPLKDHEKNTAITKSLIKTIRRSTRISISS